MVYALIFHRKSWEIAPDILWSTRYTVMQEKSTRKKLCELIKIAHLHVAFDFYLCVTKNSDIYIAIVLISAHQNRATSRKLAHFALLKYSHFFLALRYSPGGAFEIVASHGINESTLLTQHILHSPAGPVQWCVSTLIFTVNMSLPLLHQVCNHW